MENVTGMLDPYEEVKKLQDKVRKLELQNEELRTQQNAKNGIIEHNFISQLPNDFNTKICALIDGKQEDEEILNVENQDLSDEESWLCAPENEGPEEEKCPNLHEWLRMGLDDNKDFELQLVRNMLLKKLEDLDRGVRHSIDTRTFTRPKKKMSPRPPLSRINFEYESEKLRLANRESEQKEDTLNHSNSIPENIPVESHSVSVQYKVNLGLNNTFSVAQDNDTETLSKCDQRNDTETLSKSDQRNDTETLTKSALRNETGRVLNTTFQRPHNSIKPTTIVTERIPTPRQKSDNNDEVDRSQHLNNTFTLSDESDVRSDFKGKFVCDSGDDDRLSSASDSSFSNRLLNVGDVQNLARMQEESLKQMSTPKAEYRSDGIGSVDTSESLPSPILRSHDDNHGYLSDSDHSPRTRSSQSSVVGDSLHSSPASSPFGSQTLPTFVANEVALSKLPHNGFPQQKYQYPGEHHTGVNAQVRVGGQPQKSRLQSSEMGKQVEVPARTRVWSGLRPPSANTNQKRGALRPTSSIPRPQSRIPQQSRIPAPRMRSTAYNAQPANKMDWMDGCY